jgi:hypothetical protein
MKRNYSLKIENNTLEFVAGYMKCGKQSLTINNNKVPCLGIKVVVDEATKNKLLGMFAPHIYNMDIFGACMEEVLDDTLHGRIDIADSVGMFVFKQEIISFYKEGERLFEVIIIAPEDKMGVLGMVGDESCGD